MQRHEGKYLSHACCGSQGDYKHVVRGTMQKRRPSRDFSPPRNRPASLHCTIVSSQGQKQILGVTGWGLGRSNALYRRSRLIRGQRSTEPGARLRRRDLERFHRLGIDPQASSVQVWHFPGQKLRLGGDALGADPTYLLYLAYRSHGGI